MPEHIKATSKAIRNSYERLDEIAAQGATTEQAVRDASKELLYAAGKLRKWTMISEQFMPGKGRKQIKPDGIMKDEYYQTRGLWEGKDLEDNLDREIQKKIAKGYPLNNIIFEDTRQAVLYQNGMACMRADLADAQQVADLLN